MKIDEQLIVPSTATRLKNARNLPRFEHWLNTSAKQNSGDEYYWQHQDQLQQSNLHFEAKPLPNQPEKQIKSVTNKLLIDKPETIQKTSINGQIIGSINQHELICVPPGNQMKINNEAKQLLAQINATATGLTDTKPCKSMPVTHSKELKTEYVKNETSQYKNHHLFIQEEQAEVTLNTQELDQKEQKELIQLIKNSLKKNKLNLKQLIINGVNHD